MTVANESGIPLVKTGAALQLEYPELLCAEAYINGRWVGSEKRITVANPATGAAVGDVPNLGETEALEAVEGAERSLAAWRARTGKERGAIVRRWGELILAHKDDLAHLLTAEQGKPLAEARDEVAYAASYLEWFAEEARRIQGDVLTPHRSDRRLLVVRQSVGVVAAVTPWNFPLAMITRKAGPALAVGCTMVLKPSGFTPLSALALAKLGEDAGIPAGVFSVITGDSQAIGQVLTGDPRVRKFTFTGSTGVGKKLAAQCMHTVKRVSLELGGNAPFIVFDDADLDAAVEGAIQSKFRNTGQTCVCTNRFLIQDGIYDNFAAKLAARVGQLVLGNGLAGPCDQGPLINSQAVEDVARHVADAVERGSKVLTGGRRPAGDGFFFEPTVIAEVPADARLCREETFGPVAGLVRFEREADAIRLANDTEAGLASYVFTRDADRIWRVAEGLEYGMVGINTGLISTEVAPFGGIKESGFGREGSRYGVDDYLEMKTICLAVQASE